MLKDKDVQLCINSGADITLISQDFLQSLCRLPKLKTGMKMNLLALTNNAKIIGYVVLGVFFHTREGKVLECEEEAYIVPGMKVPVLLGEDFQKNYNMSIHHYKEGVHLSTPVGTDRHEVDAFNEPHVDKGFEVYRVESRQDRQRTAVVSKIQKARRDARLAGLPSEELEGEESLEYIRAAEDVWIQPDVSKKVRLDRDFSGKEVWLVEQLTINMKEGFYRAGSSLLRSEDPFLHIANVSTMRQCIRQGDILGILRDPDKYLDQTAPESEAQCDTFALLIQKLAKGSASEKDPLANPSSHRTSQRTMPQARTRMKWEAPKQRKSLFRKHSLHPN